MPAPQHRTRDPRYPVDVPLEFWLVLGSGERVSGVARTVNLSSSGVLFESKDSLPPGLPIQVVLEWPSRLDGARSMQLHGTGRTVRRSGNATAMMIQQCEFRVTVPGLASAANTADFVRRKDIGSAHAPLRKMAR
jgi:hypothetical protein